MKTQVTDLFGIRYPILCGGLMWLATPELCAAISNAGGLGNLTAAIYESGEALRQAIRRTRALTDRPFAVNLTLLPSIRVTRETHADYFRAICEERVPALEVSGVPLDRYFGPQAIAEAKEAGICLVHKVGSVRHALHAEKVGYDAVIAVGFEAGGHPLADDVTTLVLVPRVVESVGIPVIAGGGIADGRGLAAALALGADGVLMGSRFIATRECRVHKRIKQELIQRQETDTTLICSTLELQARVLRNPVAEQVLEIEARGGGLEEIYPLIAGQRTEAAWQTGDVESAPLYVGQSIGLIKEVLTCQELLEGMVQEAEVILVRMQEALGG